MKKIVLHTMKDCQLCGKAEELMVLWNIPYTIVLDNPNLDEPYPIFYIDDSKFSYEEIIEKIMKGEIGT